MSHPTRSELLFAQYFTEQGLEAVKIKETGRKEPDFWVKCDGGLVFFEVKEFDRAQPRPDGGYSPLPYIKRKINKARKQFVHYKGCCCCLVLYNERSIAASLGPFCVLSALFGEYYQRHSGSAVSFHGAAEFRADSNTTLSAVITLRPVPLSPRTIAIGEEWHERQTKLGRALSEDEISEVSNYVFQRAGWQSERSMLRATVFKNPHAHQQLPDNLFRGPFDEWWQKQGERVECTFRGARLSKLWDVLPDYVLAPVSGQY